MAEIQTEALLTRKSNASKARDCVTASKFARIWACAAATAAAQRYTTARVSDILARHNAHEASARCLRFMLLYRFVNTAPAKMQVTLSAK